uniref:Uncharacterized protein n=1 Tax=viral metagenome TaxID=1070528 RepID=A0A6C0APU6_9ZZZZ
MNIAKILFVIGSILIGVLGIINFSNNKQYIALLLFVPLTIWILVLFGLRWFGPEGEYNTKTVKWPPQLNSCPDFLMYYNRIKSDGTTPMPTCIDKIGVSKNNIPEKFPEGGNGDSNDKYFFQLIPGETRPSLCARLKDAGLTWEGVYDGQTCFNADNSGAADTTNGTNVCSSP